MSEFSIKLSEFETGYDPRTGGWFNGINSPQSYGHIELEVGRMLYALVLLTQPRRVLETGTHKGYSACTVAQALKNLGNNGRIITVDPWETDHLWDGTELEPYITWINATSQELATRSASQVHKFEMLVLDSDHKYNTIMEEMMLFDKFLVPGGYLFFHDILYYDGVGAAFEQLKNNPRFETVSLDSPRTHGIASDTEAGYGRSPGVGIARRIKDAEPALIYDRRFHDWEVGNVLEIPYLRRGEPQPPDYLDYDPRKRVPPKQTHPKNQGG